MSGSAPRVLELDPQPDPLDCCAGCSDLPFLLFLDSAAHSEHLGRYSFLAADPAIVVRSKGGRAERCSTGTAAWQPLAGDPLEVVRALLREHVAPAVPGLPPFQGGAAGYIGYDWGAGLERIAPARFDDLAIPDCMLGLYDWVIAWDHQVRRAWLISTGMPASGADRARRAAERGEFVLARVTGDRGPRDAAARRPSRPAPRGPEPPLYELSGAAGIRSNFSRAGYLDAVRRVVEYVFAGDIFQANLSQRLQCPIVGPPLALYRRLRQRNPAPFSAFLDFGELVIASSSPERFLRISPDTRLVEARPIKGTRPRGLGPEHDAALGQALTESEKDRAENVMIVDLLRNDLSRVCRPGSVHAPELFALEHYATVHHLVSTVVGELDAGFDAVDLLRAAFPGGSITGAPKVRAMQIIAQLEPTQRGVYCGSIGYLSVTGALDTSIVIRTYLVLGDDVYFQVGGGIVADSDPEQEYRETLDKARGLIAALGDAHEGRTP
ncbi:MAG TPA: aminodeoxychorismate synthase component I [Gemmatimonadales bacterium]